MPKDDSASLISFFNLGFQVEQSWLRLSYCNPNYSGLVSRQLIPRGRLSDSKLFPTPEMQTQQNVEFQTCFIRKPQKFAYEENQV